MSINTNLARLASVFNKISEAAADQIVLALDKIIEEIGENL